MERFCELKDREVINVLDGRALGRVCDLIVDVCTGEIKAIIVPGCVRAFPFFWGSGDDIVIPWRNIVKIGGDVILVEVDSVLDRSARPFD